MKNSWLPLVMMAAALGGAFLLVGSSEQQGFTGPQIHPGIFAHNEKYIPPAPTDLFKVEVAVSDDLKLDWGLGPAVDRRHGFEQIAWDDVAIVLEDDQPLTSTVAKALGEHLSGFVAQHGGSSPVPGDQGARLILMVPHGATILPLTGRRMIRLKQVGGEMTPDQEGLFTVQVALDDALRYDTVVDTGLLPLNGIRERRLRVDAGPVLASPSVRVPWPQWHVTVGRGMWRRRCWKNSSATTR